MLELRTPSLIDMRRHSQWAYSPDIVALDPPAGVAENPLFWSIYLDHVHIGSVSIYNRVGLSAELGILIGDKSNWDKGYGTTVVKHILALCKQAGFTEIHLKVLPENTRAIRCYEKCGFINAGLFKMSGMVFLQMRTNL